MAQPMSDTTLFVSDLHLCGARPVITELFLDFLRQRASKARALYILGDLFEYWIGDEAIAQAVRDLPANPEGPAQDVLVFLPGEREIRDTAEALESALGIDRADPRASTVEVLPGAAELVRALAARGVREVVLVAQDSTRYGLDHGVRDGLAYLLRRLGRVHGHRRVHLRDRHLRHLPVPARLLGRLRDQHDRGRGGRADALGQRVGHHPVRALRRDLRIHIRLALA